MDEPELVDCPVCEGSGRIQLDGFGVWWKRCRRCDGQGIIEDDDD